jgi:hypothetical protein
MLRDFQVNGAKHADAMHKAKTVMVTGMAVVKEDTSANKYAAVTTAETVADIFFVEKERVPSGTNAARDVISDYDPDFVNVAANEFVKMVKYAPGERFGTDQFDSTDFTSNTALDTRVSFKNGRAQIATASSVSSPYVFKGLYNDAGHTLITIEVSDTAAANSNS